MDPGKYSDKQQVKLQFDQKQFWNTFQQSNKAFAVHLNVGLWIAQNCGSSLLRTSMSVS